MHRQSTPILAAVAAACLATACATAPTPEPTPTYQPPASASFQQTLSGDALFAFGKASVENLSDAGRAQLDALAARVLATPGIEAARLREHLISAGLPAEQITAVGRGSVEPVASCDGERGQALIDCLAPNRRVEVRVVAP